MNKQINTSSKARRGGWSRTLMPVVAMLVVAAAVLAGCVHPHRTVIHPRLPKPIIVKPKRVSPVVTQPKPAETDSQAKVSPARSVPRPAATAG